MREHNQCRNPTKWAIDAFADKQVIEKEVTVANEDPPPSQSPPQSTVPAPRMRPTKRKSFGTNGMLTTLAVVDGWNVGYDERMEAMGDQSH